MRVSLLQIFSLLFLLINYFLTPNSLLAADQSVSDDVYQDIIVVTGVQTSAESETVYVDKAPAIAPDTAYLVSRLPGAALVNNGGLSGQVQYRGVYGARVGIKVNGQQFHSAGPNLMDPPMHYAPPSLVETIEVSRGASPVSFGPSLVGGVNAVLKGLDFAATSDLQLHYDLTAIARTADESHSVGGTFGVANDRYKLFTSLSLEEGDDIKFPGGKITNTFHDRQVVGITGGYRINDSEFNLEYRHQGTGPTGNPPFAMDIKFVDSDFVNFEFNTLLSSLEVSGSVSYSDIDHEMTNFESRPRPAALSMYRLTRAGARTLVAELGTGFELGDAQVTFGVDGSKADMDVSITNPMNTQFYIDNLPDINIDRLGLYADWSQTTGDQGMSLGFRVDRHKATAGLAQAGQDVPLMPAALANQFNRSDRSWRATTGDVVSRIWKQTGGYVWRAGISRKTRVPGYLERFAWLPTAASAGLADGNNYVGDLNLNAETAWIFELGVDLNRDRYWARPTVYFHQVDNFIQGIAYDQTPGVADSPVEKVSKMSGDATPLKFANVDARMFGVDADYGIQLSPRYRLEGTFSLVRGERRDTSDNLYRITPDNMRLGLIYEDAAWTINLQTVLVRKQDHVSISNSEQKTSGYGLVNLFVHWQPRDSMLVSLGMENIFDRYYKNHLGGYNRIVNSDVALGDRVPGSGRNVYLRLQYRK